MITDLDPAPPAGGPALRAAADALRTMARRVPLWSPFDPEGHEAHPADCHAAERDLATRLMRMPNCTLASSQDGWEVELGLAGIRIQSRGRLRGACMAWAAQADR